MNVGRQILSGPPLPRMAAGGLQLLSHYMNFRYRIAIGNTGANGVVWAGLRLCWLAAPAAGSPNVPLLAMSVSIFSRPIFAMMLDGPALQLDAQPSGEPPYPEPSPAASSTRAG